MFALLWLAGAGIAAAAEPSSWKPLVGTRGELFPVLLIAAPASGPLPPRIIGDGRGMVGARVTALRDGERVRVEVEVPGYAAPARLEATLPRAGERYRLFPAVRWDAGALAALPRSQTVRAQVKLSRDDGAAQSRAVDATLHTLDEAPYGVGAAATGLAWVFAAYVDERDARVRAIVRALRDEGVVTGGEDELYALWRRAQHPALRYTDITGGTRREGGLLAQRVRPVAHTLRGGPANCVDTSVLLASMLLAAGWDATLAIVPGHMFLLARAPDGALHALETTLLPSDTALDEAAAAARFERALALGARRYREARAKFSDEAAPEYRLVDVRAARAAGVAALGTLAQGSGAKRSVKLAPPSPSERVTRSSPR